MSQRNPYKVVEKVLRVIGRVLLYVFISAVTLFALVIMVAMVWPYWGPWALTSPVLFIVGYVLIVGTGVALVNLSGGVANRWNNARYEWDRKKEDAK